MGQASGEAEHQAITMRVLGVDFGFSRIGIAVGESEGGIATPRPPLKASGALKADAAAIARLAKSEECVQVIVGVPLGGEDDRQARICRTLAEHIAGFGCVVLTVDESMTTTESHLALGEIGVSAAKRKRVVDGESARRILERFFLGGGDPT